MTVHIYMCIYARAGPYSPGTNHKLTLAHISMQKMPLGRMPCAHDSAADNIVAAVRTDAKSSVANWTRSKRSCDPAAANSGTGIEIPASELQLGVALAWAQGRC